MHIPTSLVLLLAFSVSHALVISEPNLLSADLAPTVDNIVDAVPVEIGVTLKEGQKQKERSEALESRGFARVYNFKFNSLGRFVFAGVEIVWTFANNTNVAHVVNMVKCLNPTDSAVLVQWKDATTKVVLVALRIGARGAARVQNPYLKAETLIMEITEG